MSIAEKVRGDAQCEVPSCRQYDFLPCKCGKCGKLFCATHLDYERHECPNHAERKVPHCPLCNQIVHLDAGVEPDAAVSRHIDKGCPKEQLAGPTRGPERFNYCSHPGCGTNEHVPIICQACGNQYCVAHRYEDAHRCRKAKNLPPAVSSAIPPPPTEPPPRPAAAPPALSAPVDPPLRTLGFPHVAYKNTRDVPFPLDRSMAAAACVRLVFYFEPHRASPKHYLVPSGWDVRKTAAAVARDAGLGGPEPTCFNLRSFDKLSGAARVDCVANDGDPMLLARVDALPDDIAAEAMQYIWPAERSSSAASAKPWSCPVCTYENQPSVQACGMCMSKR